MFLQEVPRLFAMRFGRELSRKISFRISDGRVFYGKYKKSKSAVYGLECLIEAYDLYHNCFILFEYIGHSEFHVSIFDSLYMDHLKDITGEYIADIVKQIQTEEDNGKEGGDQLETTHVAEVHMIDADRSRQHEMHAKGI